MTLIAFASFLHITTVDASHVRLNLASKLLRSEETERVS